MRSKASTALAGLGLALMTATPARAADLCLQFGGPSCSVHDLLGFFRFNPGRLPTSSRKSILMAGRACGGGGAMAAATMAPGPYAWISVFITFECDGHPATAIAWIDPRDIGAGSSHGGYVNYYDRYTGDSCEVTITDCTEPL